MRTGLAISAIGHAGVLVWALIAFSAQPFDATPADSLPIDLVSTTEFSQMVAGAKSAPKLPTPRPLVEKVGEPGPAKEAAVKISDRPEIVTASSRPPPLPLPKPEPKAPAHKPAADASAENPAPDAKADDIAEALRKSDTKPEPPKPPTPPKKPPPKFDTSRIENRLALLDKREQQRHAASGAELNPSAALGAASGQAATLSQSEIDALRAQIQACWNPPAGAADARDLIVRVRLLLNRDGSVAGEPIVLNRTTSAFFQVAAESATRAIRRCQPYKLPIAKYELWKDVEVTFDPRDMYRG